MAGVRRSFQKESRHLSILYDRRLSWSILQQDDGRRQTMNTVPQHLGKYELRERLGRGGMAEVWKSFDTQLHRVVALKILHADLQNDPSFITRFEREAQVIASLHHANI